MTVASNIIRQLYDLGHFRNPAHMTSITEADLPNLKLTDEAVRTAIASYQEFMAADFDRLSINAHGRKGIADGEIGPATEALFDVPRCGEPDYPNQQAVELAATGSGSWRAGCLAKWPNNHALSFKFKNQAPGWLTPLMPSILTRVREAYADKGMVFEFDEPGHVHVTAEFTGLAGSTIGLTQVPSNPSCNDTYWSKFDFTYHPDDVFNLWCRLFAHEWFHAMGGGHTRGGIMNPSIVSGPFTSTAWRGDPSESLCNRWWGGVPVNLGPTNPPTDPPTDPTDEYYTGEFIRHIKGQPDKTFILVPKPQV